MPDFTVASVYVGDKSVLNEWLLPCLGSPLVSEVILYEGYPNLCLADYNNHILDRYRKSEYVVFAHPDVRFSKDIFERIHEIFTSGERIGAVGLHGSTFADGGVNGTNVKGSQSVCELDCCFLAVRRKCGFRFDSRTFSELHGHVEDLSWQMKAVGLMSVVVEDSNFAHLHISRGTWGRYNEFRNKLRSKWAGRIDGRGVVCVDDGSGIEEFNKIITDFPFVRKMVVRRGSFDVTPDVNVLDCDIEHVLPFAAVAFLPRINDSNKSDLEKIIQNKIPVVTWVGNHAVDHMVNGFEYENLTWAQRWISDVLGGKGL